MTPNMGLTLNTTRWIISSEKVPCTPTNSIISSECNELLLIRVYTAMNLHPKATEPLHPNAFERGQYDKTDIFSSKHGSSFGSHVAAEQQPNLSATIGGEAFAAGNTTSSTGVVTNNIEHLGGYTIAFGEAIFTATGLSFGHDGASAAADTFVDVTGADFVLEININEHGGGGAFAWAESVTEYIAVDIPDWPLGAAPIVELLNSQDRHHGFTVGNEEHHPQGNHGDFGNFADVLTLANSQGANGSVFTLSQTLAIENHFSLVSGLATVVA
jgi:hypothetical protein